VLRQCVGLENLEVFTRDQVAAIPSLKSILSNSSYVTDALLSVIGQRCAKLETLLSAAAEYRFSVGRRPQW
jgi:hypothetical protein